MHKYIALLRGINVGGKNKVPMPELKALFEENGFSDVSTYINSGNVIFSSESRNQAELRSMCESAIAARFSLNIPVAILSATDLSAALRDAPDWWGADVDSKHNAIFVMSPSTPEAVISEVGELKPEYEQVGYSGQIIFWSAPLKTLTRVRWLRIVGTASYNNVTIRNANTTKKLLQLVES